MVFNSSVREGSERVLRGEGKHLQGEPYLRDSASLQDPKLKRPIAVVVLRCCAERDTVNLNEAQKRSWKVWEQENGTRSSSIEGAAPHGRCQPGIVIMAKMRRSGKA